MLWPLLIGGAAGAAIGRAATRRATGDEVLAFEEGRANFTTARFTSVRIGGGTDQSGNPVGGHVLALEETVGQDGIVLSRKTALTPFADFARQHPLARSLRPLAIRYLR